MGDLDGYIPVDERLRQFHARYPEGKVTSDVVGVGLSSRVVVEAEVTRWPGDEAVSALGSCAMPGETVYTYGSEYENAETSAVGRALVFLGFLKTDEKIASAQEVKQNSDAITEKAADHLIEICRGKDTSAVRLALVAAGVNAPEKANLPTLIRTLTPFQANVFGKAVSA